MQNEKPFATIIQGAGTRPLLEIKRQKMIKEALSWSKGTFEKPDKHVVATLPNGYNVYFLKPGKETNNIARPNPHDMTPVVKDSKFRLRFDEVWAYLSQISLVDFEDFKAILTIVYRNAYLLDHIEDEQGIVRYRPSKEIQKFVNKIDEKSEGISPFGLMGLLHFLDILGWNEDVKYHVENNKITFKGKYDFKVGRINTLLTCIRVPYQASQFVKACYNANEPKDVDFLSLYTIMQQFAKSRGTCTPTQEKLREWLSPYIS